MTTIFNSAIILLRTLSNLISHKRKMIKKFLRGWGREMKRFIREYHMDDSLTAKASELEHVINNRQGKYSLTAEYKEASEELFTYFDKVKEVMLGVPEGKHIMGKLEDAILTLESLCYSAAYKDGVSDLIAAMTFNGLGITATEHIATGLGIGA